MKKLLCLLISFLTAFSFSSCGVLKLLDDRAEKSDIVSYVKENEKLLIDCIGNKDFSAIKQNNFIQDINPTPEKDFVEFSCGGAGFGSATQYCGFYYSADDDMTEIWCSPTDDGPLCKSGDGYLWKEKDGDNTYYTEKICGHFYYYEASF